MAEPNALFQKLAPHMAALPDRNPLTKDDLLIPTFLLHQQGPLQIYYAPFDYLNDRARLVVVGITPGWTQMEIAYRCARRALLNDLPFEEVNKHAKQQARFAGQMRRNLIDMLDGLGLPAVLNIDSSAVLFADSSDLLHTTSAVRYPAFVRGE